VKDRGPKPDRRRALGAVAGVASAAAAPRWAGAQDRAGGTTPLAAREPPAAPGAKVVRIVSPSETGFDPARAGDVPSIQVIAHIFEPLYGYDPLARPVRMIPRAAAALPEVSDDWRTWVVKIRPGSHFADDPVFQGRPRELTANDYVYSLKRYADPATKSPGWSSLEQMGILGLAELRKAAVEQRKPFDYDRPIEGLQALDRYTLRIQMGQPDPRWVYNLATPALTGAVAREVVEHYGKDIGAHPVGTGPFRLANWRRASRIELVKSPSYRHRVYEGTPSDDPQAQAIAQRLKGRTLPCVDRIVVDVVEEAQPRWLTFLQGDLDWMLVPAAFVPLAVPGGRLAPFLKRKGVRLETALTASMSMHYFSMDDPVVGGYTPDRVALRRAIALAYDGPSDIRLLRNGMALPAQSTLAPHTVGYEAEYRSDMSAYDPARARALLDVYGYVDRDGDGFRETPAGKPLVLRIASLSTQADRAANELWKRSLNAVGLRVEFDVSTWPELLKKTRTGSLQIWGYSWSAQSPDGGFFLSIAYGPNSGDSNDARFSWPAFDRLFEQQRRLPDGPERLALMRQAKDLLVAYMPYKVHRHDRAAWLQQPWLQHFWAHPFMRDTWQYLDTERSSAGATPLAAAPVGRT